MEEKKNKNILSYESCKWYIKIWRQRWYLYAILLHIKNLINVSLWIDLILNQQIDDDDRKKLRANWKDIRKHIELSKMYKFSTKIKHERED